MEIINNYNFTELELKEIVKKKQWPDLYQKRRDSSFCFAVRENGKIYAARDHLGIIPLYYRVKGALKVSCDLNKIIEKNDHLDKGGVKFLLCFQTPKLAPLVKEVDVVPPGTVIEIDEKTRETTVLYEYQLKPALIFWWGKNKIIKKWGDLFEQAIKRTIKEKEVGLYLSGGMDSALIAINLRNFGVQVNGYTSAPWGMEGTEPGFAKINAKIAQVKKHEIDPLEADDYKKTLKEMLEIYKIPHAETTSLAVAHLWMNTGIKQEKQVYYGQNSDTLSGSVSYQNYLWWTHILPGWGMFKSIIPSLKSFKRNMCDHYISLISEGLIEKCPSNIRKLCERPGFSLIQKITLAGMFFGHTPRDGESLYQPGFQKGVLMSNPYYDVDLVEFYLGLPLRYRLAVSSRKMPWLCHEKKILRWWAIKYLPHDLVYRKKGFSVSFERDTKTRELEQNLPKDFQKIPLTNSDQKMAAFVLEKWCQQHEIKSF